MEKIKVEKEIKEKIIHKFYCDDCKKFLGESEEYEIKNKHNNQRRGG